MFPDSLPQRASAPPPAPGPDADPQRRRLVRTRWSAALVARRLMADLRTVAMALRLVPSLVRRPGLVRLLLALAREFPPGRAHTLARLEGDRYFAETPLATACRVLHDAGVRAGESLEELGCGPGRLSLIAAALFGLRCTALDRVGEFVERGQRVARRLDLPVEYRLGDLRHWTESASDWVYVPGTAFPMSLREHLARRLAGSRARILSLSAPLHVETHAAHLLGIYTFPWGRDRIYLEAPLRAPAVGLGRHADP